ncbi:Protein kinase domain [Macleaya cordata]|uniref:Protein kinase domain n=1 Tax=Macleaya cordata TaxID=56857 RepID=A0A200R6L9_MACCD|nr:Protein kinase domain [Macleaya cordata]
MDEASTSKELDGNRLGDNLLKSPWKPGIRAFHPYSPTLAGETAEKSTTLRVVVRRPLVARLTKDIIETYQTCNPDFKYSEALNPKRFLTSPSVGVLNGGYDNANSDLILSVNFVVFNTDLQRRYVIKDMLGHGTFGQVAKCWVEDVNGYVALKIIKNQPAYYQQALVEVSLLTMLNKKFDPEDKHHIVRILDYFVFQHHLCISFELLDTNLYELIKMNQFRGLSMNIVQVFSKQILRALVLMKDAGIIHCDLKPENILLCTSLKPGEIKIIDFGSACMEDRTVYSYIQSRYYRSPEVLLGYQYTTAIDMWSFGCIVAELFLGLPLFPGASEFDLLRRMIAILGGQPPDHVLKEAKNTAKFFKRVGSVHNFENDETCMAGRSGYQALTAEEYEARALKKASVGKEYYNYMKLEEIVKSYPYRKNLPQEEITRETINRLAMIDFLRGLIEFDPAKRWSPLQASKHPFVTGEPFRSPYKPPPETPRLPVAQNVKVDHHPGGGHWFAAGLSPQVLSMNRGPPQNSSHFQVAPFSHASSYGSLGSHGSYTDGPGLGSSYGSYGDDSCVYAYYSPVGPSGLNIRAQGGVSITGASSDARWRTSQLSHGNGLGVSPSAGNFGPMSLGASPSQFTPPNSHIQVPSGSPGKYGPTSPARGSGVQGSPLGKVAAVGHFNRRRSWGYPGTHSLQPQEDASWQGHHTDAASCSHLEGSSRGHSSSPWNVQSTSNLPNWRHQRGNMRYTSGFSSGVSQSTPQPVPLNANMPFHSSLLEAANEKAETSSLPDPGDWDPNYSDELLLQEDGSDMGSMASDFTNMMRISHSLDPAVPVAGIGRFNHTYQPHINSHLSNQRKNGPIQAYSHVDADSPPSTHDMHVGYARSMSKSTHFMPHSAQSSPSRFGQQPAQRSNHGHSAFVRGGDWNHPKVQPPPPNCNNVGPRSPGSSTFANGSSWGRRPGHPMTTIPPTSHARKDYGRIA